MHCSDLGGICDEKISAESWGDMVTAMTKHVNANHPDLAKEMEKMHVENPDKWGNEMKPKWEATPVETEVVSGDSQSIT